MNRRNLPLESIQVASPCEASWEEMKGTDHVRFCGECQKNVYNLSAMSRREAEELIERREGRMCVRLYRREDGTVMTEDCPVGLRALRRKVALIVGGVAAVFLAIVGWSAAFVGTLVHMNNRSGVQQVKPPEPVLTIDPPQIFMGKICPPEPHDVLPDIRIDPEEPGPIAPEQAPKRD